MSVLLWVLVVIANQAAFFYVGRMVERWGWNKTVVSQLDETLRQIKALESEDGKG